MCENKDLFCQIWANLLCIFELQAECREQNMVAFECMPGSAAIDSLIRWIIWISSHAAGKHPPSQAIPGRQLRFCDFHFLLFFMAAFAH